MSSNNLLLKGLFNPLSTSRTLSSFSRAALSFSSKSSSLSSLLRPTSSSSSFFLLQNKQISATRSFNTVSQMASISDSISPSLKVPEGAEVATFAAGYVYILSSIICIHVIFFYFFTY